MQKLFNRIKPKLTNAPPAPKEVPLSPRQSTTTPPGHQPPIHYITRPQKPLPDPKTEEIPRSVVVYDTEHVVSHSGTSQYNRDEVSLMTSTSSLVKMTRLYLTHLQKPSPDPKTEAISRSVVEYGTEHVVSHGGTSQYNRDGTGASACGLAALNFARIVFSMEQSGLKDTALLQAVLARECVEVRRLYSNPPI